MKKEFNNKFPLIEIGGVNTSYNIGAHASKEWIKQNILSKLIDQLEYIAEEYVPKQFQGTSNMDYLKIQELIKEVNEL